MKNNKTMRIKLFIPLITISGLLVCSRTHLSNGKTNPPGENNDGKDTIINFENCEVDKLPDGFTQIATGKPQHLD
jgi:hypothetical protein